MGLSFTTVVAAEMIAADSGLGYLIFNSRLWFQTDVIFVGIIMLGTLGYLRTRPSGADPPARVAVRAHPLTAHSRLGDPCVHCQGPRRSARDGSTRRPSCSRAHTDFIAGVSEGRSRGEKRVAGRRQLPLLRSGGVKAVCEHVAGDTPYFLTFAFRNIRPLQPTKFALQALDYWYSELEETPDWQLVLEAGDFRRAERAGKVAVVFGFEGAMPVDDDLGLLRMFHRLGIRSIGLTWNGRNLLGDGVSVGAGGGLTTFGKAAIAELNRLGHCDRRLAHERRGNP